MLRAVAALASLVVALPVLAAEPGQWGVNATASSTPVIGLTYQVSARWALRPTFSYSDRRDQGLVFLEGALPLTLSVSSRAWTLGLEVQYHLAPGKDLSPYLGAALEYAHSSVGAGDVPIGGSPSSSKRASAFLGLQYSLNRHIALFGASGLTYSWFDGSVARDDSHAFGTFRAAAGVVFYVK